MLPETFTVGCIAFWFYGFTNIVFVYPDGSNTFPEQNKMKKGFNGIIHRGYYEHAIFFYKDRQSTLSFLYCFHSFPNDDKIIQKVLGTLNPVWSHNAAVRQSRLFKLTLIVQPTWISRLQRVSGFIVSIQVHINSRKNTLVYSYWHCPYLVNQSPYGLIGAFTKITRNYSKTYF